MTAFNSRPIPVSAVVADFEQRVFASRMNSCIRKSSFRPAGLLQQCASRGDVGRQPVQLLAHVGLGRQRRGLEEDALVQTGRIGRQFADTTSKAFADGLDLSRRLKLSAGDQGLDGPDEVVDHRRQLLALTLTRGLQRVQRLFDRGGHSGLKGGASLGVLVLFRDLDDAAQGQQAVGRGRGRPLLRQLVRQPQIGRQHRLIDARRGLGPLGALGLQAQRHLPPIQPRLSRRLGQPLKVVEAMRTAKARLQRAPVDRARLDRPGPAVQRPIGPAKAGHARDLA